MRGREDTAVIFEWFLSRTFRLTRLPAGLRLAGHLLTDLRTAPFYRFRSTASPGGRSQHWEFASRFRCRFHEIPGGKAVIGTWFEQVNDQIGERLVGRHDDRSSRYLARRQLRFHLQLPHHMALVWTLSEFDRLDDIVLHLLRTVVGEPVEFDSVATQSLQHLLLAGRDQIGCWATNGQRRFIAGQELHVVVFRLEIDRRFPVIVRIVLWRWHDVTPHAVVLRQRRDS